MRTLLATGSAGFIGGNFVLREHDVTTIVHFHHVCIDEVYGSLAQDEPPCQD